LIREFRLSPPGSERGVSCDANGAFVGTTPLLKRSNASGATRWEPRDIANLSKQLGSNFGMPVDMATKIGGLKAICNALNEGDVARAQIAAVLLGIPDSPPVDKGARSRDGMVKFIRDLDWSGIIKADWDPDEHPRWPAGAPASQGGQFAPKADSDECGKYARHRRKWEIREGRDWPRDAQGRRYDVHHKKPLADGGTDDLDNIEPKQRDEHVREHMENGDFSRWGKKGSTQKKQKQQEQEPPPQTESETEGEKAASSEPQNQGATAPQSKPIKNPLQSGAGTMLPRTGRESPQPRHTRPQDDTAAIEEALMARTIAEEAILGLILDY